MFFFPSARLRSQVTISVNNNNNNEKKRCFKQIHEKNVKNSQAKSVFFQNKTSHTELEITEYKSINLVNLYINSENNRKIKNNIWIEIGYTTNR